jgi:outer membrane protein
MNKKFCYVAAVAVLTLLSCLPALSQNAAIPNAKIGVIFTEAFMDSKTGIAKFNVIVDELNRQFKPVQAEIDQMNQKAQALSDDIQRTGNAADPNVIRSKMDQLDQMKKDLQRKGDDAQAAYEKKRKELFQPLQDDISKTLEAYAKAQGINLIIDGSQTPLIWASDAIDITKPFIADFNSKNPVTPATSPK